MTTKNSILQPITLTPGCQPSTDRTNFSTQLSTFSDKIRWYQGFPQKLGGWVSQAFNLGATISGVARRFISAYLSNETTLISVLGTNSNLYSLSGSTLTNITPLNWTNCSTVSISNASTSAMIVGGNPTGILSGQYLVGAGIVSGTTCSISGNNLTLSIAATATNSMAVISFCSPTVIGAKLATDYRTLGTNPAAFVSGSPIVTITDADVLQYIGGDDVTLRGFTGTIQGITAANLNGVREVHTINSGSYTIIAGGNATGTGSGGGSSVGVASGLMTVTATAHGQTTGQRTALLGATSAGGITAAQINVEFIVRNAATNTFQVMTGGVATSSVSSSGGALTAYQTQIAAGPVNENAAQGYGAGYYGIGLYGTALQSNSARTPARVWAIDRYEATFMMTPGTQSFVYTWNGSTANAPTVLANAPQSVNFVFCSYDSVVTLGALGVGNQIFSSDVGNPTTWIASQQNQVFQDIVTGAGPFTCNLSASTSEVLLTDSRCYTFTYVGLASGTGLVWNIKLLDDSIGIIGINAGCVVNGIAYWMGLKNFYMWAGGNISIIPSSTQNVSTINNYVFNNLTSSQRSKIHCWNNEQYNEIWWHYPSAGATECDRVARLNVNDLTWVPDTFDRSCAQSPDILTPQPQLISSGGVLYNHEQGTDADGEGMPFTLTGNLLGGAGNWLNPTYKQGGKSTTLVEAIVPDSVQTGDVTLTIVSKLYPQSANSTFSESFVITPTTEIVALTSCGRFRQYTVSGNALGQSWICGVWQEQVQIGPMV